MKKTLLIAGAVALSVGILSYRAGFDAGTQETSDALLVSAEHIITHTQARERQIARWHAVGCYKGADCAEMHEARRVGFHYRPDTGDWSEVETAESYGWGCTTDADCVAKYGEVPENVQDN